MTDQTVGLPSRTPRLSRLRSLATRLLRRIELASGSGLGRCRTDCCRPDAALLARRRHFPQHCFHRRRHPVADRARGPADAPGAVCNGADGGADRGDRGHCIDQARAHEHGAARLRPLLLPELLGDGELPVERPSPLPARARGRTAGCNLRGLARLPRRRDAHPAPLGGAGHAALRLPGLVWRQCQGRAPPHAVLLREPLCLVVLCILGRDARGVVARRSAGGGAAGGFRGERLHHSDLLQRRHQAAAHHHDSSGIGGAAIAVPDAALRPFRRPILSLRRRSAA